MKRVLALLLSLSLIPAVYAQTPKAPPVSVDDRLSDLESRVKSLEAAYLTKEKPKTEVPAVKPAPAATAPAAATTDTSGDYEWKHLSGVGYGWVHKTVTPSVATQTYTGTTQPTNYMQPQMRYPLLQRLPTVSGSCGPNGCYLSVTR